LNVKQAKSWRFYRWSRQLVFELGGLSGDVASLNHRLLEPQCLRHSAVRGIPNLRNNRTFPRGRSAGQARSPSKHQETTDFTDSTDFQWLACDEKAPAGSRRFWKISGIC